MAEVKVTQADRDAVAQLLATLHAKWGPKTSFVVSNPEAPSVIAGQRDKGTLVQAFARHRHQAEQRGGEVVAWMYEGPAMLEDETIIQDRKCFPLRQVYMPSGWTETPLYAHPTPKADAMREALVRIQNEGDARSNAIATAALGERP